MRPIIRGDVPTDADGAPKVFTKYSRSRRYLVDRLGSYCSYCERHMSAGIAVEHMQPKSLKPELELTWDNFLLGCINCNSTKGDKDIDLDEFVWPDTDNTYKLFKYDDSGIVHVADDINDADLIMKIQATINLVGLQKHPPKIGTAKWEEASDRRYEQRVEAWGFATDYYDKYLNADKPTRHAILESFEIVFPALGFWSIWMNVFSDFPEVQRMMLNVIPGTNLNYFTSILDSA